MFYNNNIYFANNDNNEKQYLLLKMANRHGLIAGATGTGKTTTLKVLAESFSDAGVPVFTADIKGDLTASCLPIEINEDINNRIERFNLKETNYNGHGYPLEYWDVFGEMGHPIRASINTMGPILLSRLLDLSDAQEGVLNIIFQYCKDNEYTLTDLKDLRAALQKVYDVADTVSLKYGNVSKASVTTIIRKIVELENSNAELFFGEPELDINDFINLNNEGKGYINLLECSKLFQEPKLYTIFMTWLLDSLYNALPEVGDLDKPKIVFFFDEAHLLFNDTSKILLEKITQTVRLIRSKGVGVYFITQSSNDIPDCVLAQLSNRIQHCLHAYTPSEQKKIKTVADSFRINPNFNVIDVIQQLGVGEAISSMLDENGVPGITQKSFIIPPESHFGALDQSTLSNLINSSKFETKYRKCIDEVSAFENIEKENEEIEATKEKEKEEKEKEKKKEKVKKEIQNTVKSAGRTAINQTVRTFVRKILKSIIK